MELYNIETAVPFSESMIWKMNRTYYENKGLSAWNREGVPHNLTSNSKAGKTYAELIFGLLKDLAVNGQTEEKVYILELGSGHGRLAYHTLKHLDNLIAFNTQKLPSYCYILSDVVEENLNFFSMHPQLQDYIKNGTADVAYFDGLSSVEISLRHSKNVLTAESLNQPIVVLANYFFDSIANDLFYVENQKLHTSCINLKSRVNPDSISPTKLFENMVVSYQNTPLKEDVYNEGVLNDILLGYQNLKTPSYIFFPYQGIKGIERIKNLSNSGLMLLTMDKGYHLLAELENKPQPDIVNHSSVSIWVNFHAMSEYFKKIGGEVLFSNYSSYEIDVGCLIFDTTNNDFKNIKLGYERYVNDFGPDDLNVLRKAAYKNVANLELKEMLALIRASYYDSTFFIKILARIKQVLGRITIKERARFYQTLHNIWEMYFDINEKYDLAYEIGGLFYDLAYFSSAVQYFQLSIRNYGAKADSYYNIVMSLYQLQQDEMLLKVLAEAKRLFPNNPLINQLEKLDLSV